MSSKEKVSLGWGWDDFGVTVKEGFRKLLKHRNFADVTLLSGDCQKVEAHRVILSIFSPFFEKVLQASSQAHPSLYLKDVDIEDLVSILHFIYGGEVVMTHDRVHKFVGVCRDLQIDGFNDEGFADLTNIIEETFPSDNNNHVEISGEPGEMGDPTTIGNENDNTIDEDKLEVGKKSIELQNDGDDEEIASDESAGQVNYEEPLIVQELKTIDEMIADKLIKKASNFRCKECGFTHKRSDVTRHHIEEHHLDTGGAECQLCQKIFKTREKLRQHMYKHQKKVSRGSLSPTIVKP